MGFRWRRGFSFRGIHPTVTATVTIIESVKGPYISEGQPDTNFGLLTLKFVRDYSGALKNARMLSHFLLDSIPAGATIQQADMQLYNYDGQAADEGQVVWAYKLSRQDWTDLGVTWNSYKAGSAWTSPGGDYITANPSGASLTLPDTVGGAGWLTWDITEIVKDALAHSISVGVILRLALEGEIDPLKAPLFYNFHYGIDRGLRPRLIVTYRP